MTSSFDDIKVSTHVFVAVTNLHIDLESLFRDLVITDVAIPPSLKKKKDIEDFLLSLHLPRGTFLRIQYVSRYRGISSLKKAKKDKDKPTKFFRNAVTIVMMISDKLINFKVPARGKLQLTGCKSESHAVECIKLFWEFLRTMQNPCFTLDGDQLSVTLRMVLTNKNFNFGFKIDREDLDKYINRCTQYNSLLELSLGYTGVNIKIPFKHENTSFLTLTCSPNGEWTEGSITYEDFMQTLPVKDRTKEKMKKRYNTFLVFHSGTAIMSGCSPFYMKSAYNEFTTIINNARKEIEENLVSIDF